MSAVRAHDWLALNRPFVQSEDVNTYRALIERSDPGGVHERVSVEAASLAEAKSLLEDRFGKGKIVSLRRAGEQPHPLAIVG